MRSVPQQLERLVCAEHCRYYKPWATPEPDCRSMGSLLELVNENMDLLDAVERLRGRRVPLPLAQDAVLLRRVCTHCEHFPYNCAYRRPNRTPGAEPCGGLLVLEQLLGNGLVAPEHLFHPATLPERRPA